MDKVSEDNKKECFHDSFNRLLSSTNTCCSSSEDEEDEYRVPRFPMGVANNYDVWISEPSSIQERRLRLFRQMGLTPLHHRLSLSYSGADLIGTDGLSISSNNLQASSSKCSIRSKSDGDSNSSKFCSCASFYKESQLLCVNSSENIVVHSNGNSSQSQSLCDDKFRNDNGSIVNESCNVLPVVAESEVGDGLESVEETVCTIKNLDNGKEFVVNEVREDGMMWNKLKEVSTGKQLTMEEFDVCVGTSPIVQELMRRQNVEQGRGTDLDCNTNGIGGSGSNKTKKRGSWLKSIRNVASSVKGQKERRSSDERDTSSEKGGRRSSSATDDSQDISIHGPERVRVRQYGKSSKELTAMYKSQEIQAHNGSIWAIQFSFDGKYLASAGEDRVIHVRQVTTSERKGDLLLDKPEDGNLTLLLSANESPEPATVSPNFDGHLDKKRRGRPSISRKSMGFEHVLVPETVFALSEKPICSFEGHSDDVLDLSWSKSQGKIDGSDKRYENAEAIKIKIKTRRDSNDYLSSNEELVSLYLGECQGITYAMQLSSRDTRLLQIE